MLILFVSLTWILAYPESKTGVKETLRYMLSEKAQSVSDSLGYVPLPEPSTEISCCC